LLERKPSLAKLSRIGTPLHCAAVGPALHAIVAAKADPSQKPAAVENMEAAGACARLLVRACAPLDALDANGSTPLQAAAALGNNAALVGIAEKQKGAATSRDAQGLTALHHAARGPILPGYTPETQPALPAEVLAGCKETVAALVALRAPLNGHDQAGLT